MPCWRSRSMASALASRGRSATAMMPIGATVARHEHGRLAASADLVEPRVDVGRAETAFLEQPMVAQHDPRPSTRPSAPRPASDSTPSPEAPPTPDCLRVSHDRLGDRVFGPPLDRGGQSDDNRRRFGAERNDVHHLRRAAGQRAGLVERDAADALARSRCAPPLISTPFRAAPASAATIETGVEMTSAHGQETTSRTSAR